MPRREPRFAGRPAVVLLLLLLALPVRAALEVTPVVQEVLLEEGRTGTGEWRVRNTSAETVILGISAVDYERYMAGERDADPPKWLSIESEARRLPPGATANVRYRARLDEGGVDGESRAFVFFSARGASAAATVEGRIGGVFYLMDVSRLARRLVAESIAAEPRGPNRWRFAFTLRNEGNYHLRPRGRIRIIDGRGRAVCPDVPVPLGMPVLPGGRERFLSSEVTSLPSGRLEAHYSFAVDEAFAFAGEACSGVVDFTVP